MPRLRWAAAGIDTPYVSHGIRKLRLQNEDRILRVFWHAYGEAKASCNPTDTLTLTGVEYVVRVGKLLRDAIDAVREGREHQPTTRPLKPPETV